jgi:signal transduction histidine kinase
VDNAIKNSASDTAVTVILSNFEDKIQISVQDLGVGIPIPDLFQLFRPFSHLPTIHSHRGTGLGLYIVKSIITAHYGTLEVVTQEDYGCEFTVVIPCSTLSEIS